MVSLLQLWAPILLSAFLVFVTSSLIHMVLKWHNTDYLKLPNEDDVRAVVRKGNPPPGQYIMPYCPEPKDMAKPENQQKWIEGPVGMVYIMKSGLPGMGPQLSKWFAFNLVVAFFVAYLASRTVAADANDYLHVFRIVGTVTFLAYAAGGIPNAIWLGKPWRVVVKDCVDGLLYGLVSAGAFGWLWPRA